MPMGNIYKLELTNLKKYFRFTDKEYTISWIENQETNNYAL